MSKLFAELKRRNVVRVAAAYLAAAWLVVQLLDSLLPVFDLPETAARPIVSLIAIGFVVAVIASWFFEMTPTGLKRQTDADKDSAEKPTSHKLFDTAIIALLLIAVGYFAVDKFILDPARDAAMVETAVEEAMTAPAERSIAVLPFLDLSPDNDQEYFSDGLSEELLNLLAKIPDLKVASRTSAFAFKGQDVTIEEVASALSVGHVLEGSVRMSGNRIRVTAQLIRADDGFHVWSETYDQDLDDIFAVQDQIAGEVVDNLRLTLLNPMPRSRATDPDAYNRFLQARYLLHQYTPDSMDRALALAKDVVAVDPEYAPAYGILSSIYINQAMNNVLPHGEAMGLARQAAQTHVRLEPDGAFGYAQLAWIAHIFDGDLRSAAQFYERAIEIEPENPALMGNAAVLAEALGKLDLAIELKKYLTDRNPTNSIAHNNLALSYYYSDRLDEAEESIRTTVVLSPDYIGGQYRLGNIMLLREEYEAALAAYEREEDEEYRVKGRALANFALGNMEVADAALTTLIEDWGDQYPSEVAHVYSYRGELDNAFEWLNIRAEKGGPGSWGEQRLDPLFRNLHDDPRWDAFLVRMSVSEDQLSDISFSVALPEPRE